MGINRRQWPLRFGPQSASSSLPEAGCGVCFLFSSKKRSFLFLFLSFYSFLFWALLEIALLAGFLAGLISLLDLIPRILSHQFRFCKSRSGRNRSELSVCLREPGRAFVYFIYSGQLADAPRLGIFFSAIHFSFFSY